MSKSPTPAPSTPNFPGSTPKRVGGEARSLTRRALLRQALAITLSLHMARVLNPLAARAGGASLARINLLAINDFHGGIEDRALGSRRAGGSVALAAHLALRRADRAATLTVHAGDMVGASPPASALLRDEPAITSMDLLGVELGAVGNHEFDRGLVALRRLQAGGCDAAEACFAGSRMQYLAANVVDAGTGAPVFPPYAVRDLDGVPVGLIGCTLRETPSIVVRGAMAGLDVLDEAETINRYADELRRQEVHAVVALLHQGGAGSPRGGAVEGAAIHRIVTRLDPAVRVVVSGHTHRGYWGRIEGRIVTQAFSYGTALADITLWLDRASRRIVGTEAAIVTTYLDQIVADPEIGARVLAWQDAVRPLVERVVGEAAAAITRATSAAGESALGNLIADSQRAALATDLAFMNPGGIRADLRAGPITWGDLFTILPFANDLVRMTLTGAQIVALLNQQWQGREEDPRILQTAGLRYIWNAAGNGPRVRIDDVLLADGRRLCAEERYRVAANAFLAGGGDGFSVFTAGHDREPGPSDLDALVASIEARAQPVTARIEGRIERRGVAPAGATTQHRHAADVSARRAVSQFRV